jgi:hypothetical protein
MTLFRAVPRKLACVFNPNETCVWYISAIAAIYTRTVFTVKNWRLLLPSKSSESELELELTVSTASRQPAWTSGSIEGPPWPILTAKDAQRVAWAFARALWRH